MLFKGVLLEGDGARREGFEAFLGRGGGSQEGFDVLLAESRDFRQRSKAAVTDSNASLAVLAARGAVFAVAMGRGSIGEW